jgi:hypothetical protein
MMLQSGIVSVIELDFAEGAPPGMKKLEECEWLMQANLGNKAGATDPAEAQKVINHPEYYEKVCIAHQL